MLNKRKQIDNTNPEIVKYAKVKYSSEFSVQPIQRFDAKFPPYRQPVEIGAFSQDSSRAFQNGRGQLKFYIKPKKSNSVNFDLRKGYNEMIRKDETKKEYINDVLRWILINEEKFALNEVKPQRKTADKSRFKLIKWWAQSFLVGIPKIVCGFRDDYGIVHRLETYDTLKIPDLVKNISNPWNPAVCFNFLDQLLSFIKESVIEDNPRVAYLFKWHPGQKIVCEKLHENSEYTFLPAWFTDPPEDNV